MKVPNVFDFATSELSQDATIAYILSWANPECRTLNPALSRLGEKLLRALVKSAAGAKGTSDPLEGESVERLEVRTQEDRIDISARIDDTVFLMVEDKIDTPERPGQIKGYCEDAGKKTTRTGEPWTIMPVYLKTGNEDHHPVDKDWPHGVFLRPALLKVLDSVPDTGNTLVDEFKQHLQQWQDETDSFRNTPYGDWCPRAKQGYYLAISRWLRARTEIHVSSEESDVGWRYVHNSAGGFLGFWWHWRTLSKFRCKIYLQIEDTRRLQIRVSDAEDESRTPVKANSRLLRSVLRRIEATIQQEPFQQIKIDKPGRFRGGSTAAVVNVLFDDGSGSYLATAAHDVINLKATQERLLLVMDLVNAICSNAEEMSP